MANKSAPPRPDLPNIGKPIRRPRPFWRLFGWGSAATVALAALAMTSQTEAGGKRLQLALAYIGEPVRAVAQIPRAAETEAETRRLAAQVRELAADRERLTARIATLERNLEDVTGSIKQQTENAGAPPATSHVAAVDNPPPVPSAPAITPAVSAAEQAPSPPPLPALKPLPMPASPEVAAPAPEPTQQLAQPLPEPIPLPPVRVAAIPPNETAAAPPPPPKLEIGIDLGGATSVEALRVHWAAMKASYGPLLVGLHPVIATRSRRPSGVDYRLLAGPLPTVSAAAQLCTHFSLTRAGCRPARFNGAHLAEH
ncbi:MAG: hypothetical protein ACREB8_11275 [Pseudolabrys sp.]